MQIGPSDASVCYLHQVYGKIWAACKNCIIVFDPVTLRIDVRVFKLNMGWNKLQLEFEIKGSCGVKPINKLTKRYLKGFF